MAAKNPVVTGDTSGSTVRSVATGGNFTALDAQRPWVTVTSSSAQVMTVLGSVQYQEADVLEVRQGGAGAVSLAAASGATINAVTGTTTTTAAVGQRVRIVCITPTLGAAVWEYL